MTDHIQKERSLFSAHRQTRSTCRLSGFTRWTAAAVLALMVLSGTPVFAGKGGNGKPGGGDDGGGDAPPYMAPFVEYRVTWVPSSIKLRDVNKDGVAVGYSSFTNAAGEVQYTPHIVDYEGNNWDVNAIFGQSLAELGSWESMGFTDINALGQIGGLLFRSDGSVEEGMFALFDLSSANVTPIDSYAGDLGYWVRDMNESGDLVYAVRDYTQEGYEEVDYLRRFPYTSAPEVIAMPSTVEVLADLVLSLNNAGQMTLWAQYGETMPSENFLRQPNGELVDLGDAGELAGASGVCVSEEGVIYGSTDGVFGNGEDAVHRWTSESGWEPICPTPGRSLDVSKEPGGRAEVVFDKYGEDGGVVYREGYGPYEIDVTSGSNGRADVRAWNQAVKGRLNFGGISRPDDVTAAGFICGRRAGGDSFILTPMPIAP